MSRNDRKAVKVLILLDYLMINNFIKQDVELQYLVKRGHEVYKQELSENQFNEILGFYEMIEKNMNDLFEQVNDIRLMSFILTICDEFLIYLRNDNKRSVWEALNNFARKELPKNYDMFLDEIDLTAEISERIIEAA